MRKAVAVQPKPNAFQRLRSLTPLDQAAEAALADASTMAHTIPARRELIDEGREITETLLILDGWAARVRLLEDGRRQIVSFLLPGDLIGWCGHERSLAITTVVAITGVDVCPAPDVSELPQLQHAYALSRALEESYLIAQITRLGRLNAHERVADFLLELLDRLELAGLANDGRYAIPLTQEMVADALGLTSVHINRTVQALRRDNVLSWQGRQLLLHNVPALRRMTGRLPARVTAV